jgi:hypothetical protein
MNPNDPFRDFVDSLTLPPAIRAAIRNAHDKAIGFVAPYVRNPDGSGKPVWIVAALLLGLAVWVVFAVARIAQKPDADGWLGGIFGGLFLGLLTALGALNLLVAVVRPSPPPPPQPNPEDVPLIEDAELAPILAELEAVRRQTKREAIARVARWVYIGIGIGFTFGVYAVFHDAKHRYFTLPLGCALYGLIIAGGLASIGIGNTYGRLYKERVLPKIAAGFGLQWRCAQPPLDEIKRYALFPKWRGYASSDELYGDYRGLPLSIMNLTLFSASSRKDAADTFNGILVALTLPRGLHGITVIAAERGPLFDLIQHHGQSLQTVHLEDPAFTKTYQVHASDQVAARALLTPAFMQRFAAFKRNGYGSPSALVQDNRMMLAVPALGGALFETPSYREPAAARATIELMRGTVAAALHVADAAFNLDQSTRQ